MLSTSNLNIELNSSFEFENLPIKIEDKNVFERNPRFMELLERISQKVEPNGRSQALQRKIDKKREFKEEARYKFLEASVRVETLSDLMLKCSVSSLTLPVASHEAALISRLSECITTAQLQDMLDLGDIEGEEVHTLGIDRNDPGLLNFTDGSLEARDFCKELNPLVSEHLFSKLKLILSILETPNPDSSKGDQKREYSRVVSLRDSTANLSARIQQQRSKLEGLKKQVEQVNRQHRQLLAQVLENLETLVTHYYAGSKEKYHMAIVNYMVEKSRALQLKLKLLEMEILNSTYTKESVAAMKKIGRKLEEKTAAVTEEIESLQTKLVQYKLAGPEFNTIVTEYARLQKEIEGKKWALDKFGSNDSSSLESPVGPPAL